MNKDNNLILYYIIITIILIAVLVFELHLVFEAKTKKFDVRNQTMLEKLKKKELKIAEVNLDYCKRDYTAKREKMQNLIIAFSDRRIRGEVVKKAKREYVYFNDKVQECIRDFVKNVDKIKALEI